MNIRRRISQSVSTACILVLVAVLWIAFAPTQFGGQTSYVMVAGASMNPVLQEDDLVIARDVPRYEVGDIVTYNHPKIGPVIHRIIQRENGRYVFRGDNNDWVDDYKPSKDELIGKYWLHLPGAARFLEGLRSSVGLAIASILVAVIFLVTIQSKKKGSPKEWPQKFNDFMDGFPLNPFDSAESLFFLFAVIGLASLILGIVAFSQPTTEMIANDTMYEHTGSFSYTAAAPGDIYQGNRVTTGDPVFLELLTQFDVAFQYQLLGEAADVISGTARLDIELTDIGGWRRSITITPDTKFNSESVTIQGTIDLEEIMTLLNQLESRTGLSRSFYKLTVAPTVNMYGKVGSRVVQDQFAPRLDFELDPIQLQFIRNENIEQDPLHPREMRVIHRDRVADSQINILGLELSVIAARWIAVFGFLVAIGGAALLSYELTRRSQAAGFPYIEARYGRYFISVAASTIEELEDQVEVYSFEDLVKLASAHSTLILHTFRNGQHTFYLNHEGATYYYVMPEPQSDDFNESEGSTTSPGEEIEEERDEHA